MFTTPEQFTSANKAAVDAMLSLVNSALVNAERVAALNLDSARALLEDSAANTRALVGAKDPSAAMALAAAQIQPAVEQILAYNRRVNEISVQSTKDMSNQLESQFGDFQEQVAAFIDKAAQNAPAGSEAAFAALKSALDTANAAFDNMKNVVRQSAEASVATVSKAGKTK